MGTLKSVIQLKYLGEISVVLSDLSYVIGQGKDVRQSRETIDTKRLKIADNRDSFGFNMKAELLHLSNEMCLHILSYLPRKQIPCTVGITCQRLYDISITNLKGRLEVDDLSSSFGTYKLLLRYKEVTDHTNKRIYYSVDVRKRLALSVIPVLSEQSDAKR